MVSPIPRGHRACDAWAPPQLPLGMRSSLLISLTFLAALGVAAPAHAVAGGATVDIATVPFVASDSACTGTLIAPDRVLMAAHCVDGLDPDRAYMIVGADAHDVTQVPDASKYPMKGYASAPGYKLAFPFAHKQLINATAVDDLSIVILGKPVPGIQ